MQQPLDQLESAIGYRFTNKAHLELALTHRSVSGAHNNERLEFLGDSILNFVIGDALFSKFPTAKEGKLSRLRAALVKGETLAKLGRQFHLERYIKVGPGELKTGGASRDSTLSDAVEAIIGGVFLDADFNQCQTIILSWYAGRLDGLSLDDTVKDNKTRLQEWLQGKKYALPTYSIESVKGESHSQQFTVACHIDHFAEPFVGQGGSRRHAEQQAAGKALAVIRETDS